MSKDKHYLEKNWDGSYSLIDSTEKTEREGDGVLGLVLLVGIVIIISMMGFTPWSFFAILAWLVVGVLLKPVILFLFGLFVLYLVGKGIWWLFFT